jgi:hypothetical protein
MSGEAIAGLLADPGPFASVYIEVSREGATGAKSAGLAARNAVDQLRDQGCPDQVCELIKDRLDGTDHHATPVSRCLVASERGLLLDELSSTSPQQTTAAWDALPDIAGWLTDTDEAGTFVLALVDHEGGDVATYRSSTGQIELRAEAGGASPWEHKVRGGAWSHWNLQRSTETVWARNAEEVVAEIGRQLTPEVGLIVVGGEADVRSQVATADQDWRAEVVELESARREIGEDDELIAGQIGQLLYGRAVARRLAAVHDLHARMGQGHGFAIGTADVTDALIEGRVGSLLIDVGAAAGHVIDTADHPGMQLGAVEAPGRLRADRVLLAMAGLTDGEIVMTRTSTMSGAPVAALLRW